MCGCCWFRLGFEVFGMRAGGTGTRNLVSIHGLSLAGFSFVHVQIFSCSFENGPPALNPFQSLPRNPLLKIEFRDCQLQPLHRG